MTCWQDLVPICLWAWTCRWHRTAITIDPCCFACSWPTLAALLVADWPLLLCPQFINILLLLPAANLQPLLLCLQLNQHFTALLPFYSTISKKKNCQKLLIELSKVDNGIRAYYLLPFSKKLQKLKLSEPPPADIYFIILLLQQLKISLIL